MRLRIRDIELPISEATRDATLADPWQERFYAFRDDQRVVWSVNFEVDDRAVAGGMDEGPIWQAPRVYFDEFHLDVGCWREIEGQELSWTAPWQDLGRDNNPPNGCFYLYGHESIPKGRLSFGKRRGTHFEIRCEGVANLYAGKEEFGGLFWENVPFQLEALAQFKWVAVSGTQREDLRYRSDDEAGAVEANEQQKHDKAADFKKRFLKHLDAEQFYQGDIRTRDFDKLPSGIVDAICRFYPRG